MALIPLSAFFKSGTPDTFVRFAFCKQQALIEQALERLEKYLVNGMSCEILTTAEMARADAYAVAHGVPSLTLMENAGQAVADAIAARFKPCAVTVLCGPGNNGGDGFVVARLLDEFGFTVRVAQDAEPKGDAGAMSEQWKGTRVALTPDALDGAQAGGGWPVRRRPLPSAGRRGRASGGSAERPAGGGDRYAQRPFRRHRPTAGRCCMCKAALTVTFFRKKPGHLLLPGRVLCGEIVVADIGIPPEAATTAAARKHARALALSLAKSWRGTNMPAAIVSWSVAARPMHRRGAAGGAGGAAGRGRAGQCRLAAGCGGGECRPSHRHHGQAVRGRRGLAQLLSDKRLNAVALGPGLGVGGETRALVDVALNSGAAVVLDADAITSFKDDPEALFNRLHDAAC